jgi:uncharacterized protein YifE (UPF0438 family)
LIKPFTPGQIQFLSAIQGNREPSTVHEIAWMKLIDTVALKKRKWKLRITKFSMPEALFPRSEQWRRKTKGLQE